MLRDEKPTSALLLIGICLIAVRVAGFIFAQTYIAPDQFGMSENALSAMKQKSDPLRVMANTSSYMPIAITAGAIVGVIILLMVFFMPVERDEITRVALGSRHPVLLAMTFGMITLFGFTLGPMINRAMSGQSALHYHWNIGLMLHRGVFGGVVAGGLFAVLWGTWWMLTSSDRD